jgi:hypothetical protein
MEKVTFGGNPAEMRRVGRRWNIDPINPAWNSGYAAFFNNPNLYVDHNGLSPRTRAEKYAKKHKLEDYTITEKDGRASLQWGSVEDGVFSVNSKKFGLNAGEWLSSWFPNISGGRYSGGMGDQGAERHWSRFSDWHVDLSWLSGFFELFSATSNPQAKRTDSSGNRTNPALRERQRTETDNTALSPETKPGQAVSSGFSEGSDVPRDDDAQPQLQNPTAQSVRSQVDMIVVYINEDSTSVTPYLVPNNAHNRKAKERNEKGALQGRMEDFQGPFRK